MFKTYVGAAGRASRASPISAPRRPRGSSSTSRTSSTPAGSRSRSASRQIGKSFRNEITPRNFTFRSREFEQMEIEFFCHPTRRPTWYAYWRDDAVPVVRRPRPAERPAAAARPRQGRAGVLFAAHGRHRVRVPVRRQRAGGHRPPRRLRPDPAPEVQRQGPELLRRGEEGAVRPRTSIEPSAGADRGARWRSSARRTPRTRSAARPGPC